MFYLDSTTNQIQRGSEGDLLNITPPSGFYDTSNTSENIHQTNVLNNINTKLNTSSTFENNNNNKNILTSLSPNSRQIDLNCPNSNDKKKEFEYLTNKLNHQNVQFNQTKPLISRPLFKRSMNSYRDHFELGTTQTPNGTTYKPILKNSLIQSSTYSPMEQIL